LNKPLAPLRPYFVSARDAHLQKKITYPVGELPRNHSAASTDRENYPARLPIPTWLRFTGAFPLLDCQGNDCFWERYYEPNASARAQPGLIEV
jgi:hypothetical protein